MRIVVLLLVLTACDDLFNLDRLELPDGAVGFDPAIHCKDYPLQLVVGSFYRVIDIPATAWGAHDDCRDDSPGYTHLAVMSSREELNTIQSAVAARGVNSWWVGAVQPITATSVGEAWIWVTGTPLGTSLWAAKPVVEPNDGAGEEATREQFATVAAGYDGLADYRGPELEQALCECDGEPVIAAADMAVDQSRR